MFPDYKTKKLGFFEFMFSSDYYPYRIESDGWESLGWDNSGLLHKFCGDQLHIGKENGKLFKYCKRCKEKCLK